MGRGSQKRIFAHIGRRASFAALLATTAIATGSAISSTAVYAQSAQVSLDIPPGPLSRALAVFGSQSGTQLSYEASIVSGKSSRGIKGEVSRDQALSRILEGSGLRYSFTDNRNVLIVDPASTALVPGADDSTLLTPIVVNSNRSQNPSDTPYATPGPTGYISGEQIERFPPTTTGDIFVGTPGVLAAGNNVGTSINPNIRGLQGMGRVTTTVDGARQATSSYRGYIGNRDESYIDPDLIGGVDISKGPSSGAGVGGIGGTINFRTLEAQDIIKEGRDYGVRLKTDIGSNTTSPADINSRISGERPSFLNDESWSGSIAAATTQENFDFIGAYSRRQKGNYFTGSNLPSDIVFGTIPGVPNAAPGPGSEAFNTSQDTNSQLAKLTLRFADDHSLELGYSRFDSKYGEINELQFQPWVPSGQAQHELSHTTVNTYTAKYRYLPQDNPLVDFRANVWLTDLNANSSAIENNGFGNYGDLSFGGDVSNSSTFETAAGEITWQNGLEIVRQDAESSTLLQFGEYSSPAPIGERTMESIYTNVSIKPVDWLTLKAGARYDHYDSKGKDYLASFPEKSGQRISPNFGITVEPINGVQLYGLYTEGYRPPSLRESHWHYGSLLLINPELQPELAKNVEFGINVLRDSVLIEGDSLRLKASIFNNNYNDYIVRMRPPGEISYIWNNIAQAHYRGLELSASYDSGKYFVDGSFTKYAKIEYCPTDNTCTPYSLGQDYGGSYVPPVYSGTLTAGFRAFDDALTLGARLQFVSERAGGGLNSGPAVARAQTWPHYNVVDLFGSYDFGDDLKAHVSVQNLFDRYYIDALSSVAIGAPGRTMMVGLTKTF